MRGDDDLQEGMFSDISPDNRGSRGSSVATETQVFARDPEIRDVAQVRKTVSDVVRPSHCPGATVVVDLLQQVVFAAHRAHAERSNCRNTSC